jgi:hypothetical protein
MSQNNWKSLSLLSIGFVAGIAYLAACGTGGGGAARRPGIQDAAAAGSGLGRVLSLSYGTDGHSCGDAWDDKSSKDALEAGRHCCPAGFTWLGWRSAEGTGHALAVCIED